MRHKYTQEELEKEIKVSQKLASKEKWQQDNGETFRCKFCRNTRQEILKSKEKEGWCRLCTGETKNGNEKSTRNNNQEERTRRAR